MTFADDWAVPPEPQQPVAVSPALSRASRKGLPGPDDWMVPPEPSAPPPQQQAPAQPAAPAAPPAQPPVQQQPAPAQQPAPPAQRPRFGEAPAPTEQPFSYSETVGKTLARAGPEMAAKTAEGLAALSYGWVDPYQKYYDAYKDWPGMSAADRQAVIDRVQNDTSLHTPGWADRAAVWAVNQFGANKGVGDDKARILQQFKAREAGAPAGDLYQFAGATPPEQHPFMVAGKRLEQAIEEDSWTKLTPEQKESYTGKITALVAGVIPLVAAGTLLGPSAGLVIGGAQMGVAQAGDTFNAAIEKGADPQTAARAAGLSYLAGSATGMVPLEAVFTPLRQTTPGLVGWAAAKLNQAMRSGVTFATVGEVQEWLGQEIAKAFYDPNTGYSPDLKRIITSFVAGNILGATHPLEQQPGKVETVDVNEFLKRAGIDPKEARGDRGKAWRDEIDEFMRQRDAADAAAKAGQVPPAVGGQPPPEAPAQPPPGPRPGPAPAAPAEAPVPADARAAEDATLRAYGHSDEDIAGMSPATRTEELAAAQKEIGTGTRKDPIEVKTGDDVTRAAAVADQEHTPAQGEAGNTQRAHVEWNGLPITLEAPAGGVRRMVAPDGTPVEQRMAVATGYIKGVQGADGDQLDVYMGMKPEAGHVYVLDERDRDTGAWRQHKVFIGFDRPADAISAYTQTGGKNMAQAAGMRMLSVDEFKDWVKNGDLTAPISDTARAAHAVTPKESSVPPVGVAEQPSDFSSAHRQPVGPSGDWIIPAEPEHFEAIHDVVRQAGATPDMLDQGVISVAAHEHAAGVPPDAALQRAVIQDAVNDKLLTPQQVKEAYHGERDADIPTQGAAGRVPAQSQPVSLGGVEAPAPQRGGARAAVAGGSEEGGRVPGARQARASAAAGAEAGGKAAGGAEGTRAAQAAGEPVREAARAPSAEGARAGPTAARPGGARGADDTGRAARAAGQAAGHAGERVGAEPAAVPERAAAGQREGARAAEAPGRVRSLAQFVAAHGGLRPSPEWQAMGFDYKSRVIIPGVGPRQLVSGKRGMTDDELVEQLEAAHYLPPKSAEDSGIMRRVRDMIDEEVNRKRPHYPIGHEPAERPVDRGQALHHARNQLEGEMRAVEIPVAKTPPEDIERATELMVDEGLPPLDAFERATIQNELSQGMVQAKDLEDIGGKERADAVQPSATPGDRGKATAAGARATEAAPAEGVVPSWRAPGPGEGRVERTPAGAQHVIPGAEREPERVTTQRGSERRLKPTVEQKPPGGLFGDESKQTDLVDRARVAQQQHLTDLGFGPTPEAKALLSAPMASEAHPTRPDLKLEGEHPSVQPDVALVRLLAERLRNGEPITVKVLQDEATRAYGGTMAAGAFDRKAAHDALEAAVNARIRQDPALRADDGNWRKPLARVEDMLSKLPTQRVRSEEQIAFQQFSTPPTYALAAAYAANVRPGDRILEPSAGTGSLIAAASRPDVSFYANELAPRRAALLREVLGPNDVVTTENAEQLHNILPTAVRPTLVVMNPPFSQTAGRMGDKRVVETGAVHIEQALNRLEPGGRLVAIVGKGMGMDAPRVRQWWTDIAGSNAVRANIAVEGDVYAKYGTTFGTRLLVIDKVPPDSRPPVLAEAKTVDELMGALEKVRDSRPDIARELEQAEPSGAPLAEPRGEGVRPGAPSPVRPGAGVVGAGPRVEGGLAGRPEVRATAAGGGPVRVGAEERPGLAAVEPERPVAAGAGAEPGAGAAAGLEPVGGRRPGAEHHLEPTARVEPGTTAGGERLEVRLAEPGTQTTAKLTDSLYEPYTPQRVRVEGAKKHPGPLVESAAMSSVHPPEPAYKPAIPKAIITQGLLSLPQLEPVLYAGQAHAKMLPAGEGEVAKRKGYFIGDGTGVGKGREVAGIILDNWRQGRTKAVWVSEKKKLLADAKRDWSGLGQNANHIFDVGKVKAGESVTAAQGIGFITYDTLKGGMSDQAALARGDFVRNQKVIVGNRVGTIASTKQALTPAGEQGYRVKFDDGEEVISRGQLSPFEGEGPSVTSRVDQLVDWLGPDFDGVIAFDECVPAGTMISTPSGPRPIEMLKVGDMILGFDHVRRKIVKTRVVRTFRRRTTAALRAVGPVKMTGNHPVWTENEGYIPSILLAHGDVVRYLSRDGRHTYLRSLWDGLHGEVGIQPESLLQSILRFARDHRQVRAPAVAYDGGEAPRGRFGVDRAAQPNARDAGIPSDHCELSTLRAQSLQEHRGQQAPHRKPGSMRPWRERSAAHICAADVAGSSRAAMGSRVPGRSEPASPGIYALLSNRRGEPCAFDRRRSGWVQPPLCGAESEGRQENSVPHGTWMDDLTLLEQRGHEVIGGRRRDDHGCIEVFNIETATANYFAERLLVHNSHNMANSTDTRGSRGLKEAAQKALAGLLLQDRLPNARVVYVSATGATEVSNLGYADRLGLWGRGTPFASRQQFVSEIGRGGIAAMEQVACDMKRLGLYTARSLSFDDGTPKGRVEYDRLEHKLTAEQEEIYDTVAEAWQVTLRNFHSALAKTGGAQDSRAASSAMSAFWGANQRFFNQIITSMQMPTAIEAMRRDIDAGHQVVIQLTNTNEAAQERAAAKAETAEDIEDLDITPRDQIIQLVEKSFPTQQYEPFIDERGNEKMRPVTDADGNPVQNREALRMKEELIDRLASVRVPQGPLDLILDTFGVDNVAEVTGRKRRFVLKPDDKGHVRRVEESRPASSNQAETDAYQAGRKKALVFSEAGGTGASYHADNTTDSAGARRSHFLLQAGWRADKAVQGLGRSHRTNQGSAPFYHLVTTNLDGQKRFISSIARRLAQLGALTKGQRQAGEQGVFSARDNLEGTEAAIALRQFYSDLYHNHVEGISLFEFEHQTGLSLVERDDAGRVTGLKSELPPITQFLNRLLSMKIALQNKTFRGFSDRLDSVIEARQQAGVLDVGLETLRADKIEKKADQVVHVDKESGAETKYVKLAMSDRFHPVEFGDVARAKRQVKFWVKSPQGHVYAVSDALHYTEDSGAVTAQYRITGPASSRTIAQKNLTDRDSRWTKIEKGEAQKLWDAEVKAAPEFVTHDLHLITGAILPVWDRIQGSPRVVRTQTDAGERFLGRVVPTTHVSQVLKALGAEGAAGKVEPKQVFDHVRAGGRAEFANGWSLKRSVVAGEQRIELIGPASYGEGQQVKADGLFTERINYETRYFVPTDPEKGIEAIRRVTEFRPIADLTSARPAAEASPIPGPRRLGLTEEMGKPVSSHVLTTPIKDHPDYQAAKAGDPAAAVRLVQDTVRPQSIAQARERFGSAVYVPVIAEEESGHNAIPPTLAAYYAAHTGGTVEGGIIQTNRAFHTGAQAMERMTVRPQFDGPVMPGGRYVLVDDVTVMGATLAELAHHIRSNGGEVVGTVTLVNASRTGTMAPSARQVGEIEQRFGDALRDEFGIEPTGLTAPEAAYILNFRDADSLRTRASAAREQRPNRLRSKGVLPDRAEKQQTVEVDRSHPLLRDFGEARPASVGLSLDRLSTDQRRILERALTEFIRHFTGHDVDVRFPDTIPLPESTVGNWGAAVQRTAPGAAGTYNFADRLIQIAMASPNMLVGEVPHIAAHEAWHFIEDHFVQPHEMALLQREEPRLREMLRERLKARYGLDDADVDRISGREIRADAFGYYADERMRGNTGAPLHVGIRRVFERVLEFFRAVRRLVGSMFSHDIIDRTREPPMMTPRDVFAEAFEGRMRQREDMAPITRPEVEAMPLGERIHERIHQALESSATGKIIEHMQDLSEPVRRLQLDLERRRIGGGTILPERSNTGEAITREVPDDQDFYTRKRLYPGRLATESADFNKRFFDPIVKNLKDNGITLQEAGDYLYARHVQERNAAIAEIHPEGHQFRRAATDPLEVGGSGRSQEWADDVIARAEASDHAEALHDLVRQVAAVREFILRRMEGSGLERPEIIRSWRDKYSDYVPLRGWEDAPEEAPPSFREPSRFQVRGREIMQALGRKSKADNALVHLFDQAYRTIDRAERNRYLRSVWNALADLNNEVPGALDGIAKLNRGDTKRVIDPRTGFVKTVADSAYAFRPETVTFKVGGRLRHIVFDNRDLAEAVKRMHPDQLSGILGGILRIENKIKALWTHYSPDFLFRHFMFRYPIEGALNSFEQKESGDHSVVQYIRRGFPLMGSASRAIFKSNKGVRSTDPEIGRMQDYWEEMRKAGGAMMFRNMRDLDLTREHMELALRDLAGRPLATARQRWRSMIEAMDTVTNALDNALRLAAYASAREQGKTPQQAALIAREATIDFQLKGKWANAIGLWYPFGNVAIQTGARMAKATERSKIMRRVFMGSILAGFLAGVFNYLIGGNDKDGIPFFDKMAEWERRLAFTLINPFDRDAKDRPQPLKAPMPYNWSFPMTIGSAMASLIWGDPKNRGKVLAMVAKSGLEVLTPFGQEENLAALPAPELARPLVHLYSNKDWAGRSIHMDRAYQKRPDSESPRKGTGEGWHYISSYLNWMTGGSARKSGGLDFYPEDYRYLFNYFAGGQFRPLANLSEGVHSGDVKPTQMPLMRVIRGTDYSAADRARRSDERFKERHPWLR